MFDDKKITNILIVDDNEYAAESLKKLLEHDGYKVQTAYDGDTALKIAQESYPDAIVLDLDLPGRSGYEVARALKQVQKSAALLVALSGYGQEEHKRMAKEAGFDYHMTKPILVAEMEQLFNTPRVKIGSW